MSNKSNEYSIGYTIAKTNWYLRTLLNKLLKEEGIAITNEQWFVLKVIFDNPGVSQTEIAEKSRKDKTNITRILDLLERSTYIERRRDDLDRRMYRIDITAQGKKILKAVNPVSLTTDEILSRSLNRKEIKELIVSLDTICDSIKSEL